jgi:hypothetical protein
VSVHFDPVAQVAWQGDERHVKAHVLFGPQSQWPSEHSPVQCPLLPLQVTLQGGPAHVKVQLLAVPQVQSPSKQAPSQLLLSPSHITWHGPPCGALLQMKLQAAPRPQ